MPKIGTFIFLLFFFILAALCQDCARQSNYDQAKDLYETKFRELGDQFYRAPEYQTVTGLLGSVKSDESDYEKAQALLKKITDDFREYRHKNIKSLLEKTKSVIKKHDEQKKAKDEPYSKLHNGTVIIEETPTPSPR